MNNSLSLAAISFITAGMFLATLENALAADWKRAESPLVTRWAAEVSPDSVLPEYPRPQMRRREWTNLNGLWDYAIAARDARQPHEYDGQILVPFCIESALSGVKKTVGPDNRLWYRRWFDIPKMENDGRLLLHFGAVDWVTQVWVNGKFIGEHQGGYDPFSFDITDALIAYQVNDQVNPAGGQELVVAVWDPTDTHWQPRGKQVQNPKGIFYTSVTGIWQTVWLEAVPGVHIRSYDVATDIDTGQVTVNVDVAGGSKDARVRVGVFQAWDKSKADKSKADGHEKRDGFTRDDELQVMSPATEVGKPIALTLDKPQLWSPDAPYLYDIVVMLEDGEHKDRCLGYFGMRKIEVKQAEDGFNRLFLNNRPLFQFGPLDQGWWPDGLYTAPTDEALRYDIEITKAFGFNMCRKHVKVEPARWYYWCDRLGLLVWQDMPNGDRHIRPGEQDIQRTEVSEANYRREWQRIVESLDNHPSIVAWVPFNEGWGQFKTNEILDWTKQLDATRLVDGPSGWQDRGGGDMHDMHKYPGPDMPQPESRRAVVLGEFGGLGWPVKQHLWLKDGNWGYRTYDSAEELRTHYYQLIQQLRPLVGEGLAAAIYTQTTDVEGEVNGLMTYDRELLKMDVESLAKLHAKLYLAPPIRNALVPTSERAPQTWRYTTSKPADGWEQPDFSDSEWKSGPGGFGTKGTPGSVVRTEWNSSDIWLRREFQATEPITELTLRIHHDEDAQVFLNGERILDVKGYTTGYEEISLADAASNVRQGRNIVAVHCRKTGGGQYIDLGLVDLKESTEDAE